MAAGDASQEKELYELFEEARQGDDAALDQVLEALRPVLLRTIRARVRSARATEAVAEELAQDALLRVAGGLAGCRAQTAAQLMAWCRTIARRVVIDRYRRRSSERERRTSTSPDEVARHGDVSGRPTEAPTTKSKPLSAVDHVLGKLLLETQDVLSPGTRTVIRQRLLYGDSWEEAGRAAGTTAGGAKRRYQRATARLRSELLNRIRQVPDPQLRRALLDRVGEPS